MKSASGIAPRCSLARSGSCSPASMHAAAGSSSQPISKSSDGMRLFLFPLLLEVQLRDRPHEIADPADVRGTLRDRDRATCVEQVERVRALEHEVVCRQHETELD